MYPVTTVTTWQNPHTSPLMAPCLHIPQACTGLHALALNTLTVSSLSHLPLAPPTQLWALGARTVSHQTPAAQYQHIAWPWSPFGESAKWLGQQSSSHGHFPLCRNFRTCVKRQKGRKTSNVPWITVVLSLGIRFLMSSAELPCPDQRAEVTQF